MSNAGKLFDEVGESFFNLDAKPVTRVYVDLEYIQDLRFGALLYGVTVDMEMKYIHSCLPKYNDRYDQETAKYFGALKKTDADLDKLLHTPIVRDRICFLAPFTSVYYNLIETITMFQNHNRRIMENEQTIKLVINVSDVEYPIELQSHLKKVLEQQLDIIVEVIQMPRYTADVHEYLSYDMMFLYDYGKFVNSFPSAFVGEGKFSDVKIIAMPYIESGLGHKPEDYEYVLTSTEKGMDIYCDFSFLRSNITKDNKDE